MTKVKVAVIVGALLGLGLLATFAEASQPSFPPAHFYHPAQSGSTPLPPTIAGVVTNADGPVKGALVQIQGLPTQIHTDERGAYTFTGLTGTAPIAVTAWAAGHWIGWVSVDPASPDWKGSDAINITLKQLPQRDNSKYEWFSAEGVDGSAACGLCHRAYKEWQADAHSQSATNLRFLTMYTGTNVNGQEGQPVEWRNGAALPPDPHKPYYGPGLRRDTPDRAGNCASCHTPLAGKVSNEQNCAWSGCHTSLTVERSNGVIPRPPLPVNLHGDAAEGVSCEFCHKIGDVIIDPKTKLPLPDMPGILSLRLYRPANEDQQVFFGTLIDVTRGDSYLPLLSKSEFCAGCHFGVFGGVVGMGEVKDGTIIYNSYGEWLASPYSDPNKEVTCQACHMPPVTEKWFVFPERGGLTRDYLQFKSHAMLGATHEKLLQNSVTMKTSAQRNGNQIEVQVSITNDKTGHHVPTDAPIRSMILVVEALDADGKPLALRQGPANPAYSGDLGGLPGKTFAKVLKDEWTGETPTGAFWRPVKIVEDTRLAAMTTDTTRYTFDAPAGKVATVKVRLVFRRAFYELMKQKGWNDPDILMEHETIQVPAGHAS